MKKLKKIKRNLVIIIILFFVWLLCDNIQLIRNAKENNDYHTEETDMELTEADKDVMNILLIGQDSRDSDKKERSDSMILVSFDQKNKDVKMISFMRDMYVDIPGYKSNRINASYKYGGKELLVKTIETNFDINIDNTVEIDFYGFKDVIDAIGGIEIDVKEEEINLLNGYISDINLMSNQDVNMNHISGPGLQTLNGTQSLAYARIRYVGNGDFERTQRQRTILVSVAKKAKESGLVSLMKLYDKIMPMLETDLNFVEIIKLAKLGLAMDLDNLNTYNIPADAKYTSKKINDMAVLVPDIDECKMLLNNLNVK